MANWGEEGSSVLISRGKGVVRLSAVGCYPCFGDNVEKYRHQLSYKERNPISASNSFCAFFPRLSIRALSKHIRASKMNTLNFVFHISHANTDTFRHDCEQEEYHKCTF